jgi:Cft2 family RNA processing exonuclease
VLRWAIAIPTPWRKAPGDDAAASLSSSTTRGLPGNPCGGGAHRGFDLSGHADREELVDYARTVKPSTVYLAHGDADAREWFNTTLKSELPDARIVNPVQGEIYAT